MLVRLCRERETGVLHASRGVVERTFRIKKAGARSRRAPARTTGRWPTSCEGA